MTHKELLITWLETNGTTKTTDLSKQTGIHVRTCHNLLRALMADGLVGMHKETKTVSWYYLGDELQIKQTWSGFVPPKVKHTHPLMTAWF